MKDSEFIDLLNLYLDHEISPADAARLEAEVLGNPARREIYRDYCRMQKACGQLAGQFQTQVETLPDAGRKVVAFEPVRPVHRTGTYAIGTLIAAAACLAVVFVNREQAVPDAPAAAAQENSVATTTARPVGHQVAEAPAPERGIARTVTVSTGTEPQAGLVSMLTLAGNAEAKPESLLLGGSPLASQFEWIRTTQPAPMQHVSIEDFHFDTHSTLRADDRGYPQPVRGPAEQMNALRFQK